MNHKDEIVKLLLKFCYGAEDVFIHSYPDDDTLLMIKYVSFEINDNVKHMLILERDHPLDDVFDIKDVYLKGRDGVLLLTPKDIVIFPTHKVRTAIDDYKMTFGMLEEVPVSIINGFLTRIDIDEYVV